MHYPQYFLHGEKAIGDHAQKKRRDDGSDRTRQVSQIDHSGHAMGVHIITGSRVPGTPNKELQEHHDTKARLRISKHKQSEGLIMPAPPAAQVVSYTEALCGWHDPLLLCLRADDPL